MLAGMFAMASCEKETIERVTDNAPAAQTSNSRLIDNRYIVELVDDGTIETEDLMLERLRGITGTYTTPHVYYKCVFKALSVTLTDGELDALKRSSKVASIEQVREFDVQLNDTSQVLQLQTETISWGAARVGVTTSTPSGAGKRVWVVDTGVQMDHPDLNVHQTLSRSFVPNSTSPGDVGLNNGHGTGVAGIIAAKANGTGVRGVAEGATVISLRIFGLNATNSAYVSSNEWTLNAIDFICQNGREGDVANLSFGENLGNATDPIRSYEKAIRRIAGFGILVSIAAGQFNSSPTTPCNAPNYCGYDAATWAPARQNHPNIFTVSSFKEVDDFQRISNYGVTTIDYCAPARNIYTTGKNSNYVNQGGGTSFASPHLAGILLMNGTAVVTDGYVNNDPDGVPDPIPHL